MQSAPNRQVNLTAYSSLVFVRQNARTNTSSVSAAVSCGVDVHFRAVTQS
jgi:hypothetical protein